MTFVQTPSANDRESAGYRMSDGSWQSADAEFISVEGENSLSMEQSAIPAKSLLNTSRAITVSGVEMRMVAFRQNYIHRLRSALYLEMMFWLRWHPCFDKKPFNPTPFTRTRDRCPPHLFTAALTD